MQKKMRMHQMPQEDVDAFLAEAGVGRLATNGPDGYPTLCP